MRQRARYWPFGGEDTGYCWCATGRVATEQEVDDVDEQRLTRLLTALHATSSDTAVLQRICTVCADVARLDGAGLSRISKGHHEVLAASGPQASSIEALQVTLAEGPCVDVVAHARPHLEPDLTSPDARARWPRFADAAVDQGVTAVFAFPLMRRGAAIGALDVYARRRGDLIADAYADAVLLADLATLAVDHHDAGPTIPSVGLVAETSEPWAYPAVVHQASGMVAARLGIHVDEALLRLRAHGFVSGKTVAELSRDVVERRTQIESWSNDA
jgi:transcriptional regulator with GAF, ATPase, and Fis domain